MRDKLIRAGLVTRQAWFPLGPWMLNLSKIEGIIVVPISDDLRGSDSWDSTSVSRGSESAVQILTLSIGSYKTRLVLIVRAVDFDAVKEKAREG